MSIAHCRKAHIHRAGLISVFTIAGGPITPIGGEPSFRQCGHESLLTLVNDNGSELNIGARSKNAPIEQFTGLMACWCSLDDARHCFGAFDGALLDRASLSAHCYEPEDQTDKKDRLAHLSFHPTAIVEAAAPYAVRAY